MAVGSPPTVRRRQLGRELRKLREDAGLHIDQLAEQLRCSSSRISRIETARIRIAPGTVHEILDVLGVDGERRRRLVTLARQAEAPGWWQEYTDVLTYEYATYIALESEASSLRIFEPSIVHGLLQTDEYAAAMLTKGPATHGDVSSKLAARMARQAAALGQSDRLALRVVLDEAAIRRMVGGPGVMRRQLSHLIDLSHRPNVHLQVLPFSAGAPPSATGPFTIVDFPDPAETSVVYMENFAGDLYVERTAVIETFAAVFHQLTADAMSVEDSLTLIERLGRKLG